MEGCHSDTLEKSSDAMQMCMSRGLQQKFQIVGVFVAEKPPKQKKQEDGGQI